MMLMILAQQAMPPLVNENGGATPAGMWLLIAIGVIFGAAGGVNQILGAIARAKELYGRKPSVDDDLQRYSQTIEKMKADLAKLPPSEKFEALVEKLGNFATVTQIAAIEISLEAQMKEVRAYAHTEAHGAIEVVNAHKVTVQNNSERLAVVEAVQRGHEQLFRDVNLKLDKVGDRITEEVKELIREGLRKSQ